MHSNSLSHLGSIASGSVPVGIVVRHGIVDDGHILTFKSFTQHKQGITLKGACTMSSVAAMDEMIIVSHGIGHRTEHHAFETSGVLKVGMIVPDENARVAVFTDNRNVGLVSGHNDLFFVGSFPDKDALAALRFVITNGKNGILDGKIIARTILGNHHII